MANADLRQACYLDWIRSPYIVNKVVDINRITLDYVQVVAQYSCKRTVINAVYIKRRVFQGCPDIAGR